MNWMEQFQQGPVYSDTPGRYQSNGLEVLMNKLRDRSDQGQAPEQSMSPDKEKFLLQLYLEELRKRQQQWTSNNRLAI
jgi:hypothetical protein